MDCLPITDSSHIAEARRRCVDRAGRLGLDEQDRGRVALVATELATNVLKHGRGGELLAQGYELDGTQGLELCGLDRGPGMANVEACLVDGYSTAGTPGHGLGIVRRQTQFLRIASWPGLGSAVLCRVEKSPGRHVPRERGHAAVMLAKPGEEVCGDAWCVLDQGEERTLMVADGLGHGAEAAAASSAAVLLFRRHQALPPTQILQLMHAGLRSSRGAAVSLLRLAGGRVTFAGVGNVAGAVVAEGQARRLVTMPGTVGHALRKAQAFDYVLKRGLAVLQSDGLATSWAADRYPGFAGLHPGLAAALLYRDFVRRTDDVTVLVAAVGAA